LIQECIETVPRANRKNDGFGITVERECGIYITSKYDEIMSLPHHVSKNHSSMPMLDCAAQLPTLTPLAILMRLAAEPGNSLALPK